MRFQTLLIVALTHLAVVLAVPVPDGKHAIDDSSYNYLVSHKAYSPYSFHTEAASAPPMERCLPGGWKRGNVCDLTDEGDE